MDGQRLRKVVGALFGLLVVCCGLELYGQATDPDVGTAAKAGTFTTFDAPSAGTGVFQGTFALGINPAGTITGLYYDANNVSHGFVRASDGAITTFDPPGALSVQPSSINPAGKITGYYCDAITCHSFLRAGSGAITTFDPPDSIESFAASINLAGEITGTYYDENEVAHGYLRAANGAFTTIDDPNAGTGSFQGTSADGINPAGEIVGCYTDASNASYAFVRSTSGAFTMLAPPTLTGDYPSCLDLYSYGPAIAINAAGAITGAYFQPISGTPFGGDYRGYLRATDGTYQTFDAADYPPCCIWTFGLAINVAGAIVGYQNDGYSINHGFLRALDGVITTLDAPGAGTGYLGGTIADAINPAGVVAGYYTDVNSVRHGFLWKP
jgi:hypothetical protein